VDRVEAAAVSLRGSIDALTGPRPETISVAEAVGRIFTIGGTYHG